MFVAGSDVNRFGSNDIKHWLTMNVVCPYCNRYTDGSIERCGKCGKELKHLKLNSKQPLGTLASINTLSGSKFKNTDKSIEKHENQNV